MPPSTVEGNLPRSASIVAYNWSNAFLPRQGAVCVCGEPRMLINDTGTSRQVLPLTSSQDADVRRRVRSFPPHRGMISSAIYFQRSIIMSSPRFVRCSLYQMCTTSLANLRDPGSDAFFPFHARFCRASRSRWTTRATFSSDATQRATCT